MRAAKLRASPSGPSGPAAGQKAPAADAGLDRRLEACEAEIVHLRYEADQRAKQLEWMATSRSWRLTRPLRTLAAGLYKFLRRAIERPIFPPERLKFKRRLLLAHASLPCHCLQIAPFLTPIVSDREAHVKNLDFYTTEALRQRAKAAGRKPERVLEVDYVCKDLDSHKAIKARFDLVTTSHSALGGAGLIAYLKSLRRLLNEGGLLLIDFPDRRYGPDSLCFTTSLGQFVSEWQGQAPAAGKDKLRLALDALQEGGARHVFEFEDTVLRALVPLCALGLLDYDLVEARMSHRLGCFAVLLRAGRKKTSWQLLENHFGVTLGPLPEQQAGASDLDADAEAYALCPGLAADGEEIIRLQPQPEGALGRASFRADGSPAGPWRAAARGARGGMAPERCGLVPGLVSVVLPVHNQADLLVDALQSVLAQTHRQLELIVIDDGSTDHVQQTLARFSPGGEAADPRLRCFTQPNQGLPKALSNGFAQARGEFWCWTSADNLMEPAMLARLVAALQDQPQTGMVYADYYVIDDRGELLTDPSWRGLNRPDPESGVIHLPRSTQSLNAVEDNFIGPCFLYRGWIGRLLGDYAPQMGVEDYDYWMRINAFFSIRHLGVGEPLYRYRVHDNTLSAKASHFRINRKLRQLMEREKRRAAYLESPMEVAADAVGADWLKAGRGKGLRQRPACGRDGQLIAEASTATEMLVLGAGAALDNLPELLALAAAGAGKPMPIAILFDPRDSRPRRLSRLLEQSACLALAPDALTAQRLRLFGAGRILDASGDGAVAAALAFARNLHSFSQTWSAEARQRQAPRPLAADIPRHCVLQVDDFVQGGLENVVIDLAQQLREEGFEVTLAALGKAGMAADQARDKGLRVEVLNGSLSPAAYLDWLKQNRATLVNAHYSLFAAEECREAGIPFIETIHNAYVWLAPEQLAAYRQADPHISAYVCVSDTAADYADQTLGLDVGKMQVIPNGIDTSRMDGKGFKQNRAQLRRGWQAPSGAPVFLNVASIMAPKAQLPLVRALALVRRDLPEARLVLLGNVMEEPYMQQVQQAVQELDLAGQVVFAGYHPDPLPFYQAADVFVLPSYWEGWSLSLAEAAVSGLPCVITDVGAADEFAGLPQVEVISPPYGSVNRLNHGNLRQHVYADDPAFAQALAAAMLNAARRIAPERAPVNAELAARFDRRRAYARYAELFRALP